MSKLVPEVRLLIELTINATLRNYLALSLVETASNGESSPLIAKDVSWLWRTAYNTAIQACAEWNNAEHEIADLFELCYGVCVESSIHESHIEMIFAPAVPSS